MLRRVARTPAAHPADARAGSARAETLRLLPGVRRDGLRGGLLNWDGQLEDDARLVVALARTAASYGARIVTYAAALQADGSGATVRDELHRRDACGSARGAVVNATGAWADTLAPGRGCGPARASTSCSRRPGWGTRPRR